MARQTTDFRATVAAVREETRERLVALRLEREAAWAARRRRAEPAPVASQDREAIETGAAFTSADDIAPQGEASTRAAESHIEEVAAATDGIDHDEPEPAPSAAEDPSAPDGATQPGEADPPPADESRPLQRHALAKLRISAAISTATAGLMLQPTAHMTLEPEPEPAPQREPEPDPAGPDPSDRPAQADEARAEPKDDRLIRDIAMIGAGLQSRLSALGLATVNDLRNANIDEIASGLGPIGRIIDVETLIRHVAGARSPS
jgi:hypothetical protein